MGDVNFYSAHKRARSLARVDSFRPLDVSLWHKLGPKGAYNRIFLCIKGDLGALSWPSLTETDDVRLMISLVSGPVRPGPAEY